MPRPLIRSSPANRPTTIENSGVVETMIADAVSVAHHALERAQLKPEAHEAMKARRLMRNS